MTRAALKSWRQTTNRRRSLVLPNRGGLTEFIADDREAHSVAIWLEDSRARLMVGAPAQVAKRSRWAADGTIVEDAGAGLWLKADTVLEFRPIAKGVKQVNWVFMSSQLFIPWGAIGTKRSASIRRPSSRPTIDSRSLTLYLTQTIPHHRAAWGFGVDPVSWTRHRWGGKEGPRCR